MKPDNLYRYLDDPHRPEPGQHEDALLKLFKEVEALPEEGPDEGYWHYFDARLKHRIAQAQAVRKPWYARLHLPIALSLGLAALLLFLLLPRPEQPSLDRLSDEELALMADLFSEFGDGLNQIEASAATAELLDLYDDDGLDIFASPEELPNAETLAELMNSEG